MNATVTVAASGPIALTDPGSEPAVSVGGSVFPVHVSGSAADRRRRLRALRRMDAAATAAGAPFSATAALLRAAVPRTWRALQVQEAAMAAYARRLRGAPVVFLRQAGYKLNGSHFVEHARNSFSEGRPVFCVVSPEAAGMLRRDPNSPAASRMAKILRIAGGAIELLPSGEERPFPLPDCGACRGPLCAECPD